MELAKPKETLPADQPPDRWSRIELVLWIGLALLWLIRYLINLNSEAFIDLEELQNGTLTRGLLEGLIASPWQYQYQPWAHGPLVYGLLLYPFFLLGGSSLFWTKIIAFCFAATGGVVWMCLIRRAWGRGPALMFALWWLAPPPFLERYLHLAWANHMESIFLGGLIVWAFARAGETPPRRIPVGLAAGWAGVASFFCMQNFIFALAAALCVIWRWRKSGLKLLIWPALPAFLVGFSPHLLYCLATGYRDSFWGNFSLITACIRWRDLFVLAIPQVVKTSISFLNLYSVLLIYLCVIAGIGLWLRPQKKQAPNRLENPWLGRLLLVYFFVYLLVYAFGKYYVEEPFNSYCQRYLVPLLIVLAALTVGVLGRLPYKLGWVALLVLLALPLYKMQILTPGWLTVKSLADGSFAAEARNLRGDDYGYLVDDELARSWMGALPSDQAALAEKMKIAEQALRKLPRPWKFAGYQLIGQWLGVEETLALLGQIEDGFRTDMAFGAGMRAVRDVIERPIGRPEAFFERLNRFQSLDPLLEASFVAGAGRGLAAYYTAGGELFYFLKATAPVYLPDVKPPQISEDRWLSLQAAFVFNRSLIESFTRQQQLDLISGAGRFRASDSYPEAMIACFGLPAEADILAAYRQGYATSEAFAYLRYYRRIPCSAGQETFVTVHYPELAREKLKEFGVTLRRENEASDLCRLEYGFN